MGDLEPGSVFGHYEYGGDGDDIDAGVIEPIAQIVLDHRHGDEAG